MIKEYNKNIDFLRFLFSIIIVIFHMYHYYLKSVYGNLSEYKLLELNTASGWICVEFFFIISGYYLYNTAFSAMNFKEFAIKKILRLWPAFAIALFLDAAPYWNLNTVMKILLLECTGFSLFPHGILWFVPCLFWALLFYFALIKLLPKKYVLFIISLLVYFSYTYLINKGFKNETNIIFSGGMIRAIASIGLGYLFHEFCGNISESTKERLHSRVMFVIFSVIECYLLYFLVYATVFCNIKYNNNFIFILAFLPLMFSFVFKLGILSKILDNDFSKLLGKYSYAIYVVQSFGMHTAIKYLKNTSGEEIIQGSILTICVVVLFGIILQELVDLLRNIYRKRKTND